MDSITYRIIRNGKQETLNVGLIEDGGQYFVESPVEKTRVLLLLDPKRLEKPSEIRPSWNYTGILLEHTSRPTD